MTGESVQELAVRAIHGDRTALAELVGAHLPAIEAFVRLRVGKVLQRKESCADIALSACREALHALPGFEFRGPVEFRAWLFQHASRKLADKARYHLAERRDARREQDAATGDGDEELSFGAASICSPSRHAMGREELAAFERAFAALPEDHREAIALHRIGGVPYDRIAASMDRSEGAVRNLVYRGLARVAIAMGVPEPGARAPES